jgi:hypothetical protein
MSAETGARIESKPLQKDSFEFFDHTGRDSVVPPGDAIPRETAALSP